MPQGIVPSALNYGLFKGIPKFKPQGESSYYDLGNPGEVRISPKPDYLPHWNNRMGQKFKDFVALRAIEASLRITLDEFVTQNLLFYFLGLLNTPTTILSTDVAVTSTSTAATLAATTGLVNGTTYKISDGGTDIPAGTSFTYTGSTSIVLSQAATGPNATDPVTITPSYDKVSLLNGGINIGAFRLVNTNNVGPKLQLDAPLVIFGGAGDLDLVGDDWGRMELTGDILGDPVTGSFGTVLYGITEEVTSP